MKNLKSSSIGVALSLLLQFGFIVYFYPILPESMLFSHSAIVAFILAVFGIIGVVLKRGKTTYINMPNREYWFAPERKAQSSNEVLSLLLWILCSVLGLMLLIFYSTAESAISGTHKLDAPFVIGVGCFMLFDMFIVIYLMVRFSTIPK